MCRICAIVVPELLPGHALPVALAFLKGKSAGNNI